MRYRIFIGLFMRINKTNLDKVADDLDLIPSLNSVLTTTNTLIICDHVGAIDLQVVEIVDVAVDPAAIFLSIEVISITCAIRQTCLPAFRIRIRVGIPRSTNCKTALYCLKCVHTT